VRRHKPASRVIIIVTHPAEHNEQTIELDGVDAEHDVEESLTVVEVVEVVIGPRSLWSTNVHNLGQAMYETEGVDQMTAHQRLQDGQHHHAALEREATAATVCRGPAHFPRRLAIASLIVGLNGSFLVLMRSTVTIVVRKVNSHILLLNAVIVLGHARRVRSPVTPRLMNAIGTLLIGQQLRVQRLIIHGIPLADE
jgi:hypothetical protein